MGKIRVLVAEDYPIFREGLCRILDDEKDIKVVAKPANSGEAVRLAGELMPDVAIIDADATGFNGIEFGKQIKKSSPKTAILVISSCDWESHILTSVRIGATGYLLKHTSITELINAVRSLYAGEVVFDKKVANHILRRLDKLRGRPKRGYEDLRNREIEVLRLAATGKHNREIASMLSIGERTVQTHLVNIFRKLGVSSRTEAAVHALKEGLLNEV
ncbi:MAG: response regulator transcription factor [Deltaproteobacteria bacterium]|nr:response regulator transcription factor [Deltaproteobacteria bacterium]